MRELIVSAGLPDDLTCGCRRGCSVQVLSLAGPLTARTQRHLRARVHEEVAAPPHHLVLDLRDVTAVDLPGAAALLVLAKVLRSLGCRVSVAHPDPAALAALVPLGGDWLLVRDDALRVVSRPA